MNVVVLNLNTRQSPLPAGTTAGKFRFILTDSSGTPATQDMDTPTSTFSSVADGAFSADCQRLDTNGNPFGNVANVTGDTGSTAPATFDEPATLSFVVNPPAQ